MKIKPGAQIAGLDIRMRPALIIADRIWREHGQELVVTSGLDGEHSAGSLHYYGLALDFRSRYFSPEEKAKVVRALRERLPHGLEVVEHATHIHVEYDV